MLNLQKLLKQEDISIAIAGSAGQGLKTLATFFPHLLKESGYYCTSTQEIMSRIRGGTNSVEIRFSNKERFAFLKRIDLLIALNKDATTHLQDRISSETIIISTLASHSEKPILSFPVAALAEKLGNAIYANTLIIGMLCYLFDLGLELPERVLPSYFASLNPDDKQKNLIAVKNGFTKAEELWPKASIRFPKISASDKKENLSVISGAQAIASGAIAGGCCFVCAYPMSPSTGVLINMAKKSHAYHIGVEQVEDEIAAANMAIGAWYAGGRALVTTSGGGFALMSEAISLSGMTETPLVIMIGQRPGPATGLPTRTEQGDLNLVLHAGHGEFPRILLAPGSIEEAFALTQHAFDAADQFQVPVFILADQYILDSFYTAPTLDEKPKKISNHIVKTKPNYKRFQLTPNGISPRGIPGYGEGIVCADSDEHTEEGYITEDFSMRIAMQNKRMQKLIAIKSNAIKPTFYGHPKYKGLLICWGTTFFAVKEALDQLNDKLSMDLAMLHFGQIYPLKEDLKQYFDRAHYLVAIENNSTHQFATLLESTFHLKFDHYILQYDGLPFAVETLVEKIKTARGHSHD